MQRPAGMSREAFALLDGSHPVVPTFNTSHKKKSDLQGLKEKRKNALKGVVRSLYRRSKTNCRELSQTLAIPLRLPFEFSWQRTVLCRQDRRTLAYSAASASALAMTVIAADTQCLETSCISIFWLFQSEGKIAGDLAMAKIPERWA